MQTKTFLVLSQYREASAYADQIGSRYHFPRKYLGLLQLPGIDFIYYEPKKRGEGEFFGCGEVRTINPDPNDADQFFAEIANYRPFTQPVPGVAADGKLREEGPFYNKQNAVRRIDPTLFSAICSEGGVQFSKPEEITKDTKDDSSLVITAFGVIFDLCRNYPNNVGGMRPDDPLAVKAETALKEISVWLDRELKSCDVPFSIAYAEGKGAFPRVPWICALPSDQKVNDGVYAGICFGKLGEGLVAGFMQSVTNPKGLKTVERNLKTGLRVDVDGSKPWAKYNSAFANPLEMLAAELDLARLGEHLRDSFLRALTFLKKDVVEHQNVDSMHKVQKVHFDNILEAAEKAINATGFFHPSGLVERFLCSIASKPFVILTGNSGTGKTKFAQLVAHWLTGDEAEAKIGYAVIPVGADWTDNRNIIGFVNHLRLDENQNPTYQSTVVLDFILRAHTDSHRPYFLILDEMNLSHVERYFSDFLSAMESKKQVPLHTEKQHPTTNGGRSVPNSVPIPPNLFVLGTVNVDETTYMFSSKVLDRANVIEVRIDKEAPTAFLSSGGRPITDITPASMGYAKAFLDLSYRARGINGLAPLPLVADPANLPPEVRDALADCQKALVDIFQLMQSRHQEFAFRSMSEIMRFLAVDYELTPDKAKWAWQAAMDAQILQKILPKLHGSKRKISSLLAALAKYCEKRNLSEATELLAKDSLAEAYPAAGDKREMTPDYKNSHAKLCEMIETLRRDQFVSFIQ